MLFVGQCALAIDEILLTTMSSGTGPHPPVACGNNDPVLSGEGVRGQPLDVPVPHDGGLGQERGKGEVGGAGDAQLTNLVTSGDEVRAGFFHH